MAALKDKVAKQVQKALQTVGDLAVSLTYVSVTVGAYDVASDVLSTTTLSYPNVTAVSGALTEAEVDYFPGNRNTQKLLIAALDLEVEPKTEDYVLIDAVKWEVKRVKSVPGKSLYIVFVQEP